MLRHIVISVALTILFTSPASSKSGFEDSYLWPLKLQKKLSSGFGDIRPGRFHMGLDLRTNGQEGAMVYAPEDGYVQRFKTSYTGYGKALYVKGVSGRTYVFGHLQKYNWDIGTYLRERQIESRRYYQDFQLDEGVLPVKKGQFIARTGQTGAGAPHLHFEIRNAENQPTNPLYYSVNLKDKNAPGFQAVWLSCQDDFSLYAGGNREIKLLPVYNRQSNRYEVPDTVLVSGRFVVKTAIEDIIGKGSFALGPSHIRLFIDGRLYHEIEYDRIDFDENVFSILDRDSDPAKKDYKRVYNLYRKTGTRLSNYKAEMEGDGSFSDTVDGIHNVLIEASDPFGNIRKLEFAFYYSAAGEILAPFNKAEFSDSLAVFVYDEEQSRNYFDSAALLLSGDYPDSDNMQVFLNPEIKYTDDALTMTGNFAHTTNYQLQFFKNGRLYPTYYFSTEYVIPQGQKTVDSVQMVIQEKGLHLTAMASSSGINWLQAEIATDIGNERLFYRKTGNRRFSLYYRPGSDVGRIESVITRGPVGFRPDTAYFPIHCVRAGKIATAELKPGCNLVFEEKTAFDDELLFVRDTVIPEPQSGYYIYGPFILGPETSSFADWADLQTEIPEDADDPEKFGLYVYHEEKGWLWAGGNIDAGTGLLHSQLGGAGILAIIADTAAPVIEDLNIEPDARIKISRPEVRFRLIDELSGVENDLNFNVSIDDRWMVPEFDPERKTFIAKPHWSLTGGRHTLKIEINDRSGNTVLRTHQFSVGAKIGP